MGLNLDNISSDDIERVNDRRNPPSHDAGDNISNDDDIFGNANFDDINDLFGGGDENQNLDGVFGGNGGQQGQMGQYNQNGQMGQFNPNGQMNPGYNQGFMGAPQSQAMQVQPKQDWWDTLMNHGAEGVSNSTKVMSDLIKSFGSRTADDLGYFATNLIKVGAIGFGIAILLAFVGGITGVKFINFLNLSGTFIRAFALTCGFGIITLGASALAISGTNRDSTPDISSLPDAGASVDNDATEEYEEELGDIMDELFGSDEEVDLGDDEETNINLGEPPESKPEPPKFTRTVSHVDFKRAMNEVPSNRILNRAVLFETFEKFLPTNNPDFADKKVLDSEDADFKKLETICLKAMANVIKCDISEVDSLAQTITETFFSYEIKMKRVKGLSGDSKMKELASEIALYMKSKPSDEISVSVDIMGDYYYMVVSKGITPIITFADMFNQQYVRDFYLDEKNKLPMITGVTELGEVILDDAKAFDTMLIAGKPRSGKSWYVLSILLSLMLFNSPEDVQFIIVDPKESNLFKTLALMPHVAGLHNDSDILNVMDDVILNEASRRKKLLADNRCDDIWALRKKGIQLPVLYFVIDEYITVKSNLGDLDKELDGKLQVMISQLPSQGIRLIFVPHRATGVVNKTNRTMLQYTAAVRADNADVIDTLGIKNWTRPLTRPGDIAVKNSNHPDSIFVRGAAVTTSDEDNSELIENVAKAFYKMGVDLPDMSTMTIAANRDERQIREQLTSNNRIQYDVDTDLEDI